MNKKDLGVEFFFWKIRHTGMIEIQTDRDRYAKRYRTKIWDSLTN
jgi:hypothetical protein